MSRRRRRRYQPIFRVSRFLMTAFAAFLFTLFFTLPLEYHYAATLEAPWWERTGWAIFHLLFSFGYMWALLYALRALPWLLLPLLPLLCMACCAAIFAAMRYAMPIDSVMAANYLDASFSQIAHFLSLSLLCWITASFLFGLWLAKLLIWHEESEKRDIYVSAISALFLILMLWLNQGYMTRYLPFNLLVAYANQSDVEPLPVTSGDFRGVITVEPNTPDSLVIALVIFDGMRGDFLPKIDASDARHFVAAKSALACDARSNVSIPCLLSSRSYLDDAEPERLYSLVQVLKPLDFRFVWVDGARASSTFSDIVDTSDLLLHVAPHELMDFATKGMRPLLQKYPGNLLLVIHVPGASWAFDEYYPETESPNVPTCKQQASLPWLGLSPDITSCEENAIRNSYSNLREYNAKLVDALLQPLASRATLAVITGAHGVSLGEEGRYLAGQPNAPEQLDVPLVFYASSPFLERRLLPFDVLASKSNEPMSHDVIFHSLLECAGISGSMIEPGLSLCR